MTDVLSPTPATAAYHRRRTRDPRPVIIDIRESLAANALAFACDLLNQQLWHWGRDICDPRGNLLLQAGFSQLAPPARCAGSSIYRKQLSRSSGIWLHSYGIFFGQRDLGGIFCRRFRFVPESAQSFELTDLRWTPDDADDRFHQAATASDSVRALAAGLCQAASTLESQLGALTGHGQRCRYVQNWHPKSGRILPAGKLAAGWLELRQVILSEPERLWGDTERTRRAS
jgi:hypothetical protein